MARQQPIELFMPPNMLKAKAGSGFGGIDMAAVKRAETAMETLKSEFAGWLADDVKNLLAARARYAQDSGAAARDALMRAAHDIKGQAATFDFPLIARIAGSLSRLIGKLPAGAEVPLGLVDAHAGAIQVIHRDNLRDPENRMALTLLGELEARVGEALAKAAKR
jgi:chemotaxis protein histidine kinase CheA